MIIEYGFKNFFSFREESTVSFRFDNNVPDSVSHNSETATVLGIKGGNASGKTNLIRALRFIKYFVSESVRAESEKKIPVDCFYLDRDKPAEFFIEFKIQSTYYKYEVSLTQDSVQSENISKKEKKWVPIATRALNDMTYLKRDLSGFQGIKLNSNASFISMYSQFSIFEHTKDLYAIHEFFDDMVVNVNRGGILDDIDFKTISEFYHGHKKAFEFAKSFIKKCDLGIKDIKIFNSHDQSGDKYFYPRFYHHASKTDFPVSYQRESKGTTRLYNLLGTYWLALEHGVVLAMDEFDIHLHALLLPHLLDLFENPKHNKKNAQFVFTAHNTEIIDTLGKYRTILVNKEDNESYCYRLDELPGSLVRNDRPIAPLYVSGKIGGIPTL
jgi:AAA15 family ATPase/GTPase